MYKGVIDIMTFKLSSTIRFTVLLVSLLGVFQVKAQSTFGSIRNILNTHCNTANCHNAATPTGDLVFDGTDTDVYSQLVMRQPNNQVANGKGDVLVKPGYPEKSFLLRKLNMNGWDDHPALQLDAGEGDHMPYNTASLRGDQIELIRQWILFGCPDTGVVVDTTILYDFYNGRGMKRTVRPDAPLPIEGTQLRYGPFFLAPNTEQEYFFKYDLENIEQIIVDRIDVALHPIVHHFNIEMFLGQRADQFPIGFREATIDTSDASATIVLATQFSQSIQLPDSAAFAWNVDATLDLNGHAANTSADSVVAIEAYINIYYATPGQAIKQMFSILVNPSFVYDSTKFVLPPGQEVTFTDSIVDSSSNAMIDVWMLTSHTHKYGTSYNVYERDVCGGKGELLYNGNYDQAYNFDQGYFDYEHPSVRIFDDMPRIPLKQGLIHEATYFNYSTDTVYFGLTTKDEMMNIFMQYMIAPEELIGDLECIDDTSSVDMFGSIEDEQLSAYPNPFHNTVTVKLPWHEQAVVKWQLVDVLGRTAVEGHMVDDSNDNAVLSIPSSLPCGQYILSITNGKENGRLLLEKR